MVSFTVSEAGHSGRIIPGRCWPGFVRPNRQTAGPVHPAAEAGTTDGTRDRRSSPVAAADPARDVHPAGGSYASGGQRPDVAAQADAGLVGSCEADVSRPSCGPMGRTAWSCSLLGLSMRDWGKPRISSLGLSRMLESDPFRGLGSSFGRRRVRREIFVVCPVAAGGSTWVTPGRVAGGADKAGCAGPARWRGLGERDGDWGWVLVWGVRLGENRGSGAPFLAVG